jgi:chromosome segregation ATPase
MIIITRIRKSIKALANIWIRFWKELFAGLRPTRFLKPRRSYPRKQFSRQETNDAIQKLQVRYTETHDTIQKLQGRYMKTHDAIQKLQGRYTKTHDAILKVKGRYMKTHDAILKVQGHVGKTTATDLRGFKNLVGLG